MSFRPYGRWLTLGLMAATLTLAACQRREEAPEAPPAPAESVEKAEAPADPDATPLTYESRNAHAEVKLTLPAALRAQPGLHEALYREGVANLREFTEGAQADRTEYAGDMDLPAYEREIEWQMGAETPKLISLERLVYEYTGGAHPNTAYGAALWDKALRRPIQPAQLFRTGADMRVLDQALCDAINAAKQERSPTEETLTLDGGAGGTWSCPRALETPFVLAPSGTAGRAGGLVFLIGPYVVGPYAEGGYEIVVPQQAFRALIAPAYVDEFAGAPPRLGDVSDLG